MKVLICEKSFKGHRKNYFEYLSSIDGIEIFGYGPENIGLDKGHFFKYDGKNNKYNIVLYLKWIGNIRKIVKEYNIELVHILDADTIMYFCGIGFSTIPAKILLTYHHFYDVYYKKMTYHFMLRRAWGVVHTDRIKEEFEEIGINKIYVCNYPAFCYDILQKYNVASEKRRWNIDLSIPTIGIIGALNDYKNINEFLSIIRGSEKQFQVFIFGGICQIDEKELRHNISMLADKAVTYIKRPNDEEYLSAIVASDIIFCIYNKSFDGASGPLTDGVCTNKMILSCNHGSLGKIVSEHHLGYCADSENRLDILNKTEMAVEHLSSFSYDDTANAYKERLMPYHFRETYRHIYLELGNE